MSLLDQQHTYCRSSPFMASGFICGPQIDHTQQFPTYFFNFPHAIIITSLNLAKKGFVTTGGQQILASPHLKILPFTGILGIDPLQLARVYNTCTIM